MMEAVTYGWLICCAVAPSVAALSVWSLFIFHTYRGRWRNLDIFFVVITIQQILSAFCIFGYAVVNVIRSRNETSCNFVVWGLTTLRMFQLSTLTSLAIDRCLVLKWPYKYRFSVRQNQIKYHIVVLGVISSLVGVTGVFARSSGQELKDKFVSVGLTQSNATLHCTLHPFSWDFRFNVFLLSLYATLTLTTLFSFIYTEILRLWGESKSRIRPNSRISSLGDLVVDPLSSNEGIAKSTTNTITNTGSYRSLYGFQTPSHSHVQVNQESIRRKVIGDKLRSADLRWAPVLATVGLCYAINHGPSLVFMILGLAVPRFWNPVHDNLVIWFTIIEGLLFPISLYVTDELFRDAVKHSFRRRNAKHFSEASKYFKGAETPFPKMTFNDFVLIDKPYGALMKTLNQHNSCSTLNLGANSRRPLDLMPKTGFIKSSLPSNGDYHLKGYFPFNSSTENPKLCPNNGHHRYMFPTIYGVEKVLSIHGNRGVGLHPDEAIEKSYQNNTFLTNSVNSEINSIKKEKLCSLQRISRGEGWSGSGPLEDTIESWQSHLQVNRSALESRADHLYASLADTISANSTLPQKPEQAENNLDSIESQGFVSIKSGKSQISADGFSLGGFSFTTSANDDFEFHDTRAKVMESVEPLEKMIRPSVEEESSSDESQSSQSESSSEFISSSESETDSNGDQIYNNLAFQLEAHRYSKSPSNKPFRGNKYKNKVLPESYHKRRGRQFFSASDLQQLDYGKDLIKCRLGIPPKSESLVNLANNASLSAATPKRKSRAEHFLLSTLPEASLPNNPKIKSAQEVRTLSGSSDSLESAISATNSFQNQLFEGFREENIRSSLAIRQKKMTLVRKAKDRAKLKKNRLRSQQKPLCPSISRNNMTVHQDSETLPVVPKIGLSNINRIGSYAQDWNRSHKHSKPLTVAAQQEDKYRYLNNVNNVNITLSSPYI